MKIDCPACKLTIEGDSPLALTLELKKHILSLPNDENHKGKLSDDVLEAVDREVTFAATVAHDDSDTRKLLRDGAKNLNIILESFRIYAVSHAKFIEQACLDVLIQCKDDAAISDMNAGRELFKNLHESLTVVERLFRR